MTPELRSRGLFLFILYPARYTQIAGRIIPVTSLTAGPVSSRTPMELMELAQLVFCPGLRSHHQAQFTSAVP